MCLLLSTGVLCMVLGIGVSPPAGGGGTGDAPPPGGISLLPGYAHQPGQGIDSKVGAFVRQDGWRIEYEIGRVTRPGAPAMGGDFRDEAQDMNAGQRQWYKEQTVRGQPVHLALSRDSILIASFPTAGANFRAKVRTQEELAEFLLTVLSQAPAGKPK